jgi:uncharacterized protein
MPSHLKPLFSKIFDLNWKFGLFLILLVCVPRFVLVLQANASGNYGAIGLIMTASALAPFVFLSKAGRVAIGIKKAQGFKWLLVAFLAGLGASVMLYFLGKVLYDTSYQNWYQYIGKSYKIPADISAEDKQVMFGIMAITGMIFSPIGEELFFRGIVHKSFENSIGEKKASVIDGFAFALTHISHFGLVFVNEHWAFYPIPTLQWVLSMFLVSLIFYYFRKKTESLLGAIICHAAFNLGMIFCIFYGM